MFTISKHSYSFVTLENKNHYQMKFTVKVKILLIFSNLLALCNSGFAQDTTLPHIKTIFLKKAVLSKPIEKTLPIPTNQRGIVRIDLEAIPLSMGDSFVFVLRHASDSLKTKTVYPTVQYSYLEGGTYRFSYWLEKNGQKSTIAGLVLEIEKKLPEQWWFQIAMILSGGLLVFGFSFLGLQYNYRQKMREQNMRLHLGFDLHDRIGSALTSINVWGKILKRDALHSIDEDSQQNLEKIITTSKETVTSLRETVWSINPEYDDMGQLFEKMRSSAFDLLIPQNINVSFDEIPKGIEHMKISMGQRRCVFDMFKEIMTNITKHAAANGVNIHFKQEEYQVRLVIQDDGKGFDTHAKGDGHGLKSLRQRANEHFIDLTIQSEEGKGTTITLVIPEL